MAAKPAEITTGAQRTFKKALQVLATCSSLLLRGLNAHIEVRRFHEPIIVTRPLLIWILQLEVKVAHDLWHELRHFQIGNMSPDTRSTAETELQLMVSIYPSQGSR